MKACILRQTEKTPPGSTLRWLENKKIPYSITDFSKANPTLPAQKDFDVLFICGGGVNVDQTHLYPWLLEEKEFIHRSLDSGKKIIGLCLGGQLLAEALGAKVGPHTDWEFGWFDIESTNSHRVFPTPIPKVFQYHRYTFQIPKEALSLARSKSCENQAFIWKDQALAFQFHPEATTDWVLQCSQEKVPAGPFVQSPTEIVSGLADIEALQLWYFEVLNRFLAV